MNTGKHNAVAERRGSLVRIAAAQCDSRVVALMEKLVGVCEGPPPRRLRLYVCGARERGNVEEVTAVLDMISALYGHWSDEDESGVIRPRDIVVIYGDKRGAGGIARDWAIERWHQVKEFPMNWSAGLRAKAICDRRAIKEGRPDLVVAFPGNGPKIYAIGLALEEGIDVLEVEK